MKAIYFKVCNIRCFTNTGDVGLSQRANIFVGPNNSGKSTLLRSFTVLQGSQFNGNDVRDADKSAFVEVGLNVPSPRTSVLSGRDPKFSGLTRLLFILQGTPPQLTESLVFGPGNTPPFSATRPHHSIVPFASRRKAMTFQEAVTANVQNQVTGTFEYLYSRVDLLATSGHPKHEIFKAAVQEIIGLPITTRASQGGKQAGYYATEDKFITLDQMGDGVVELVALIVELCIEKDKIFVLEEPESNLHPAALKRLLALVRQASLLNQFMIATHSNVVVRELAADSNAKIFQVTPGEKSSDPSSVREVPSTPVARTELLRELGYEFADFGLHEAWLFLEESSAESVINDFLVPSFAPALRGRLRTFAAGGTSKIEPAVSEFQRLVTFIHLEAICRDSLWVRLDGDEPGKKACAALRSSLTYLDDVRCGNFAEPNFEAYFPKRFQEQAKVALETSPKNSRREAKAALLNNVLTWTKENPDTAKSEWMTSAAEPITFLQNIEKTLTARIRVS